MTSNFYNMKMKGTVPRDDVTNGRTDTNHSTAAAANNVVAATLATNVTIDNDEILLSKELLKMKCTDRNDIEEEIHGVRCLCPAEDESSSPHFLHERLQQLHEEIEHGIPPHDKVSYQNILRVNASSYVTSTAFRLQVLRCALFDVRKAAHQLCAFCNTIEEYFGSTEILLQPSGCDIQLTSLFTTKEIKLMRKGLYQFLPFRDRSGRRIFCCFNGTETLNIDNLLVIKMLLYFAMVQMDTETQRKGYVIIAWYREANFNSLSDMLEISRRAKLQMACIRPLIRTIAFHICTPDTPFFRLRRSLYSTAMIRETNARIRFHVGTSMELMYALKPYGIPVELIPISSGGTIKITHHSQWLLLRKEIERRRQQQQQQRLLLDNNSNTGIDNATITDKDHINDINNNNNNTKSKPKKKELVIVELPGSYDVVFRKGKTYMNNPGNMYYQTVIEQVLEEQDATAIAFATGTAGVVPNNTESTIDGTSMSSTELGKNKKELQWEVIQKIENEKNGRFLEWVGDLDEYTSKNYDNTTTTSDHSQSNNSNTITTTTTPMTTNTTGKVLKPKSPPKPKTKNRNTMVSCWVQIQDYDSIRTKITSTFMRYRIRSEVGTLRAAASSDPGGGDKRRGTVAAAATAAAEKTSIQPRTTSGMMNVPLPSPIAVVPGENNTNDNNNLHNNKNDNATYMFMNKRQKYSNDNNGRGCFGNYFQNK